jgi:flavin reductase (DIM6/NTAB) family NADH-FMN oxidoreductase RutF
LIAINEKVSLWRGLFVLPCKTKTQHGCLFKKIQAMRNLIIPFILMLFLHSCQAQQPKIKDVDTFEKQTWESLDDNAIRMIGKDWMLISAGTPDDYNMMTASWGTLGWLWQKPVAFIFVRPQRHTHNYTESAEYFTLTFYKDEHKDILKKMGTVSGRNFDKMNYEKLTALETENGSVGFEEAYLVVECKKLYARVLDEDSFTIPELAESVYPKKDYHTMYVGEIVNVWRKKN